MYVLYVPYVIFDPVKQKIFSIFRRSHPLSSRFWLRVWNRIPCSASGWIFVSSALRPSRIIPTQGAHFSLKVSFNISKLQRILSKHTLEVILQNMWWFLWGFLCVWRGCLGTKNSSDIFFIFLTKGIWEIDASILHIFTWKLKQENHWFGPCRFPVKADICRDFY